MRRFTAVFKRDKSDSHQPSSSRPHPSSTQSLKRHLKLPLSFSFTSSPPVHSPSSVPSTPQLSSASEHGQSSGSSSGSASLSLPTPEEDSQATSLARSATRRSWKDWLGGNRSEPAKVPKPPKPTEWDAPTPVWNERPPTLQNPRTGGLAVREVDDTDEGTSSEFDDEGSISLSEHPRPMGPPTPAKARQNLELLIKDSLAPTLSSSPFVQHPSTHVFPRSCNRHRGLSPALDIRRSALNRRLLRRLQELSVDNGMEILPFASMRTPVLTTSPTLPDHSAVRPPKTTQIFLASPGLRRWISRPCFEDRFAILLPSKDGVHWCPVVGTLAVAALEYSEFLDVMVDPDFDPSSPPPDILEDIPWAPVLDQASFKVPPLPAASDDPSSSPSSLTSRHVYIPSPSPLRNQHRLETPAPRPTLQTAPPASTSPPLPSPVSPLSSQSSASSPPSSALPSPVPSVLQSPISAPVKRVVRFVEDDSDDTVPLHILRQKKKREGKAKFLRTEQRRRLMELEQERRRLEAEEIEKERRRLVTERERKETAQRLYAEEVVAARLRRESQRAGTVPGTRSDASNLLMASPSTSSLGETQRNRPRELGRHSLMPHHTGSSSSIPRREASESVLQSPSSYPHETSSYRANHGGHSPAGSNSGHGHPSRPGSMYSTSSEDGRPNSRRYSAVASVSSNTARPFAERTPSSTWSGSNQSLLTNQSIPPVPPIPEFVNDLVLLPPSAPFMMHQYPRQSRHSSPGPSNSSGSLRGNSASSSSERVNMQRHSSRPMESYSAPPSPGTSPSQTESRPSHSRRGSGDSRRSSMPMSQQSYVSRSQPNSLSRGRPQMPHSQMTMGPQYLQPPSPWTALPTQHGFWPTAMPVSMYSHPMGLSMPARDPSSRESTRERGGAKRQTIS